MRRAAAHGHRTAQVAREPRHAPQVLMQAMMQMTKIVVADLEAAARG
jgi:hypothetical protein